MAANRSMAARELAQTGECNGAIGAMVLLDGILDDACIFRPDMVTVSSAS
jgi:hypothetical protein